MLPLPDYDLELEDRGHDLILIMRNRAKRLPAPEAVKAVLRLILSNDRTSLRPILYKNSAPPRFGRFVIIRTSVRLFLTKMASRLGIRGFAGAPVDKLGICHPQPYFGPRKPYFVLSTPYIIPSLPCTSFRQNRTSVDSNQLVTPYVQRVFVPKTI